MRMSFDDPPKWVWNLTGYISAMALLGIASGEYGSFLLMMAGGALYQVALVASERFTQ